jgi:hypothetical protein
MSPPGWVWSRWFMVPVVAGALILGWNLYVSAHDDGLVEGSVVDARGRPVSGATVILFERGFVTHNERDRQTTDAGGSFRFSSNVSHSLQLEAESPALGRSERRIVRLWFRSQNVVVDPPLAVPGAGG